MNRMNDMQHDYVSSVFAKIKDLVNGRVNYKYFSQLDAVIFTICFKEFKFEYPIKNIQETIINGQSTDEIVNDFCKEYKMAINHAFFKSGR